MIFFLTCVIIPNKDVIEMKHFGLIKCVISVLLGISLLSVSVFAEDDYIVHFRENPGTVSLYANNFTDFNEISAENGLYTFSEDDLAMVKNMPNVDYIEPNYPIFLDTPAQDEEEAVSLPMLPVQSGVRLMGVDDKPINPNDPYLSYQWNVEMVKSLSAWRRGVFGKKIRVGIIDSGINTEHMDLENKVVDVIDYLPRSKTVFPHATMVAGIIASETDNRVWIAGNCEADLVSFRMFDSQQGQIATLVKALQEAVDVYHCDVINLSVGFTETSTATKNAIQHAIDEGVIVVAASGNISKTGDTAVRYPAGYDDVVGVTAIDKTKEHVPTSVINDTVDVAAPGKAVITTLDSGKVGNAYEYQGGSYKVTGTSFACPHVTAAAAIMKQIFPKMTSGEFEDFVMKYADDLGDAGYDTKYGAGLLNVEAMLDAIDRDGLYLSDAYQKEDSYVAYCNNQRENTASGIMIWLLKDDDGTMVKMEPSAFSLEAKETTELVCPFDVPEGYSVEVDFTEEKVYFSDLQKNGDEYTVYCVNMSDKPLFFTEIWSVRTYHNKKKLLSKLQSKQTTVEANTQAKLVYTEAVPEGSFVTLMLWNGFDAMKPVAKVFS